MTEPEQWARDLWQRALDADDGIWDGKTAALTIQRAFEERERELREAAAMAVAEMSRSRGRLEAIAGCNEDRRIAAALGGTCDHIRRVFFPALATRQDAPKACSEDTSHDQ